MNSECNVVYSKKLKQLKIFLKHYWPVFGVLVIAFGLEVFYFWISPSVKGINFLLDNTPHFDVSLAREGNDILSSANGQITEDIQKAVEVDEGIYGSERPRLPLLDLRVHLVSDGRDHALRYLDAVVFAEVVHDVAGGEPLGVERDDPLLGFVLAAS